MWRTISLPLAIGDRVSIAAHRSDGGIEAVITAVCIRESNYAVYKCTYMYEGIHRTDWFVAQELKVESSEGMEVGFRNHH